MKGSASAVRFCPGPPYAVCPGGEEVVLKTMDRERFAGSNPVHGAIRGSGAAPTLERSSTAEHPAYNREAAGASPAVPITVL